MSILNQTTPAQQEADQIRLIIKNAYQQDIQNGTNAYNLLWNNRNATPTAVLAALGTDAEAVFEFANENVSTINAAASIGGITPPTMPGVPAGSTVTFNEDGSANLAVGSGSSSSSGH